MMPPMRLPDFLIIGAQKAGTTTLHHALAHHPALYLPPRKELRAFDASTAPDPAAYASHFASAPPHALCGEASPGYLTHPRAPDRIHRLLPHARLILTLRDPIARAYSQYWDHRRWLRVTESFDALAARPLADVYRPGQPGYFSRGNYAIYLDRYLERFAPEQILVLRFAELQTDPTAFFARVFAFLGVPPIDLPALRAPHNPRSIFDNPAYRLIFAHPALNRALPPGARRLLRRGPRVPFDPPPITPATEATLRRYHAPYDMRLAARIGPLDW